MSQWRRPVVGAGALNAECRAARAARRALLPHPMCSLVASSGAPDTRPSTGVSRATHSADRVTCSSPGLGKPPYCHEPFLRLTTHHKPLVHTLRSPVSLEVYTIDLAGGSRAGGSGVGGPDTVQPIWHAYARSFLLWFI